MPLFPILEVHWPFSVQSPWTSGPAGFQWPGLTLFLLLVGRRSLRERAESSESCVWRICAGFTQLVLTTVARTSSLATVTCGGLDFGASPGLRSQRAEDGAA